MAAHPTSKPKIVYPESDGKPMADNTKQLEAIVYLYDNLCALFADREDVFVAADLFWYPVEGHPEIRTAPDVMVVLGRPKGHRPSYKQWEEGNVAPQVVFEVLSPSNRPSDLIENYLFYQRYGVEEYYLSEAGGTDAGLGKPTSGGTLYAGRGRACVVSPRWRTFCAVRGVTPADGTGRA